MALFDENANTTRFTEIDFRGEPAPFTESRIDANTAPLPLKKYEAGQADEHGDHLDQKEIEDEFLGTLIVQRPIGYGAGDDDIDMTELEEGQIDFYPDKYPTLASFVERHGIDAKPRTGACSRDINGIEFADDFAGDGRSGYRLSLDVLHLMQDGEENVFDKVLQTDRHAYFKHGDEKAVFMDDLTRSRMPEFAKECEWRPSEANAAKMTFYDVEVQGVRALNSRPTASPASVPKALHVYEVDSDPANTGGKHKLPKRAYVNFENTLITERPLDLGEAGCTNLSTKDVTLRSDRPITLKEFASEIGVCIRPPKHRER